jgi:hypothetical protein
MISLPRGVFECRRDVLGFEQREIVEDLFTAGSRRMCAVSL